MHDPEELAVKGVQAIEYAQTPLQLSRRDGKLLRLVPQSERLSMADLQHHLKAALAADPILCQSASSALRPSKGRNKRFIPKKHEAAWLRGVAYLAAGNIQQAQLDAQTAAAYAPAASSPPPSSTNTSSSYSSAGVTWVPALLLLAQVQEAQGEWAQAALCFQQTLEVLNPDMLLSLPAPTTPAAGSFHPQAKATTAAGVGATTAAGAGATTAAGAGRPQAVMDYVAGKLRQLQEEHLSPAQAAAVAHGGAEGLQQQLEDEHEATLPEFMRKRPKWYYYNKWMSSRIAEEVPGLPEPVVQKLLEMDAGDLDLMIQNPLALQGQVLELQYLLESEGPEALAQHKPELLSWEEVQALSGPTQVQGLPLGYTPPKPLQQAQRRVLERFRAMEAQGLLDGPRAAVPDVAALPPAVEFGGGGNGGGIGGSGMDVDRQGVCQEQQQECRELQQQKEQHGRGLDNRVWGDGSYFDKQPQQQQQKQQHPVLPSQDSLDPALAPLLQKGVMMPLARQSSSLDATMILQQEHQQQGGQQQPQDLYHHQNNTLWTHHQQHSQDCQQPWECYQQQEQIQQHWYAQHQQQEQIQQHQYAEHQQQEQIQQHRCAEHQQQEQLQFRAGVFQTDGAEGVDGTCIRVEGTKPRLPSQASLDVAMVAGNLLQHLGIFPSIGDPQGCSHHAAADGGRGWAAVADSSSAVVAAGCQIDCGTAASSAMGAAADGDGEGPSAAADMSSYNDQEAALDAAEIGPTSAEALMAEPLDVLVVEGPSACSALSTAAAGAATDSGGTGWVTGRVTSRREFILQYSKLLQGEVTWMG